VTFGVEYPEPVRKHDSTNDTFFCVHRAISTFSNDPSIFLPELVGLRR
jgi:hypothetical protein